MCMRRTSNSRANSRSKTRNWIFRACVRQAGSAERKVMIEPKLKWPVQRQCASVGLPRSTYYYRPAGPSPEYLRMLAAAVALHREQPSKGARWLALQLRWMGFKCGRRLARSLMIEAQLHSVSPSPHSSTRPRPGATPAPNLLKQEQPLAPSGC